MKYRCNCKTNKAYMDYGRRGIKVCDEWLVFENFYNWYIEHYIEGLTLDRRDNDKGYSPDNCRFATKKEQANNTRKRGENLKLGLRRKYSKPYKIDACGIEYKGQLYLRPELEKLLGFPRGLITNRLALKWDMDRILSTPCKTYIKSKEI